jgi:hypothetical protein
MLLAADVHEVDAPRQSHLLAELLRHLAADLPAEVAHRVVERTVLRPAPARVAIRPGRCRRQHGHRRGGERREIVAITQITPLPVFSTSLW